MLEDSGLFDEWIQDLVAGRRISSGEQLTAKSIGGFNETKTGGGMIISRGP